MTSLDALENALHITREESHTLLQLGPSFIGNGPSFEMHDETSWDRVKKALFLVTDYKIEKNDEVDRRFFITDHPGPLYGLDDDTFAKLAALPPSATVSSDGRVLTIKLPKGASDESTQVAIKILSEVHQKQRRQIELCARVPSVREQPRSFWDVCPSPQLIARRANIEILISIPWYTPLKLQTLNINRLPKGVISIENNNAKPHAKEYQPLYNALLEKAPKEQVLAIGQIASLYSNINDNNLRISIYSDASRENIEAAIEVLTRLITTENDEGPFR